MLSFRYEMAATGYPVSECHPQEAPVSLATMPPGQLPVVPSSSIQATFSSSLNSHSDYNCQVKQNEIISQLCENDVAFPSTRETTDSVPEAAEQHSVATTRLSEQSNTCWTSLSSYIQSETQTTSHHCNEAEELLRVSVTKSQTGSKKHLPISATQPVAGAPLGPSVQLQQVVPNQAVDIGICQPFNHEECINHQKAQNHSCYKHPLQLQPCKNVTICQKSINGEEIVQKPLIGCVYVPPTAAPQMEVTQNRDFLPAQPNMEPFDTYIHHSKFQETFPAHCHPKHVLLEPSDSLETTCDQQQSLAPPSVINQLILPQLTSSVSETGLNATHLFQCCDLSCTWMCKPPCIAGPQSQRHFCSGESCSSIGGHVRTMTRDIGTMTAQVLTKDFGVQAGETNNPHIFPEICLSDESQSKSTDAQVQRCDEGKRLVGSANSPVKEVKWDAEGMTWEVYGASVDPVELGVAIQKHLELQIKETARHAAKTKSHQTTPSSQQSRWKRIHLIDSILTPVCCSCSNSTPVDWLDSFDSQGKKIAEVHDSLKLFNLSSKRGSFISDITQFFLCKRKCL